MAEVIQRVIDTEEKYAIEDQTIRGVTLKTFKNAPHDLLSLIHI